MEVFHVGNTEKSSEQTIGSAALAVHAQITGLTNKDTGIQFVLKTSEN